MLKGVIISCILVFIFFIIIIIKFGTTTTDTFPRLTLTLYDDLDAFMQYDY
jgi:hypothetical protein